MPLWPYFWNLNGEAKAAPVLRSVGRFGVGSGLPGYLVRSGLGSNVSTCDGPPFMKRWMTRLALAGEVRLLRGERVSDRLGGQEPGLVEEPGEAERAEAHAAAAKEVAAGQMQQRPIHFDGPSDRTSPQTQTHYSPTAPGPVAPTG